ncbi:mitochondrial carrier superfamily protein [Cystoisospora suis]|uniref:Mitochondrial carrier superfamily protein n=1 Tax=Cystoisospora suis TaxID=483139 RepID=A0A2C6LBL1_9APIC|nr:mitochondrial carrier superfamily protein [Cystoisospora suis]
MPVSTGSNRDSGAAAPRSLTPTADSPVASLSAEDAALSASRTRGGVTKLSPVELMVSGVASGLLTKTVCAPMDRLRLLFQVQGMLLHQQERQNARSPTRESPSERPVSQSIRSAAPSGLSSCSSPQPSVSPRVFRSRSSPISLLTLTSPASSEPSSNPSSRSLLRGDRATAKYSGILSSLRLVIKEEGVLGLWRGNGANTCRAAVAYAIKFPTNDWACSLLKGDIQLASRKAEGRHFSKASVHSSPTQGSLDSLGTDGGAAGTSPGDDGHGKGSHAGRSSNTQKLGVWDLMMAGSLAGILQKAVCYPLDLVSVRIAMGVNTAALAGYTLDHSGARYTAQFHIEPLPGAETSVSSRNAIVSTNTSNVPLNVLTSSISPTASSSSLSSSSSTEPARFTSQSTSEDIKLKDASSSGTQTCRDGEKHLRRLGSQPPSVTSSSMEKTHISTRKVGGHSAADPSASSRTISECSSLRQGMLKSFASRSVLPSRRPGPTDTFPESRQLYSGLWNCVHRIFMTEGVSGFYKGFGVALWSGVPYVMLQMTFYELWKRQLSTLFGVPSSATGGEGERSNPTSSSSWLRKLMSSSTAGSLANFTAQLIVFPFDTARKRLMADGIDGREKLYSSCRACLASIYRREGIAALYSGLGPATLRCLPAGAVQFTSYEAMKCLFDLRHQM